ncbi:hypothetical protein SLA2020_442150 [Shorea laevis]
MQGWIQRLSAYLIEALQNLENRKAEKRVLSLRMAFRYFPPLPPTSPGCGPPPFSLPSPPYSSNQLNLPIIIGAIVGIGLLLLVLFLICRHRKGDELHDTSKPRVVQSSVYRLCGYNTVPKQICYNCGYRSNAPTIH